MSDKFVELDFETWETIFKPQTNTIDPNASFQNEDGTGIMFETFGDELEYVQATDNHYIWTYGDGDDGGGYIWSGWHFVNRLGYFITEVPCPDDTDICVVLDEPNYMCENCEERFYEQDADIDYLYQYWGELAKCPKCGTMEDKQEIKEMETLNA